MTNFDQVESIFNYLLDTAGNELTGSECYEIQSFIDVGEYGLALETFVDIYAEEKKIPSDDVVSTVEKLALAMSMKPEIILQRIKGINGVRLD